MSSELAREAARLYERYATEIVERFDLCPFAAHARTAGRVFLRVITDAAPLAATVRMIAELDPEETCEVAILVYPNLALDRREFDRFVMRVRQSDAKRHPLGKVPFAMAAFHPDAELDLRSPERLIPFIRRTPDPTLQLVRRSVLDRVRGPRPEGTGYFDVSLLDKRNLFAAPPAPTTRERISQDNDDTVQRASAELEAVMADIQRDRRETYAALVSTGTP